MFRLSLICPVVAAILIIPAVLMAPRTSIAWDNEQPVLVQARQYDFGTVARGAKTVHEFKISNPYQYDLIIGNVRSSCGCANVSVPKSVIQPGRAGTIRAELNTRSFLGQKSATITLLVTQPVRREIQLTVKGNIRSDIVLEPGDLVIRSIKRGETKTVSTLIHYAGSQSWQIVDVKSSLDFLSAELEELERKNGSVKYKLDITMQGNFPVGQIRDRLTLLTSDQQQNSIPLSFTADVREPLSVSPAELDLKHSEPSQRRIVFKSDQPFRITRANIDDKRFQVKLQNTTRKTQLVTLSYRPLRGIPLPARVPIRFETNLGDTYTATVNVTFRD